MNPSAPSLNINLLASPPDYINKSVYSYRISRDTPIYKENGNLLGKVGIYSYRPNGNPDISGRGAIELITDNNISKRLNAIIKYDYEDGYMIYTNDITNIELD